MFPRLAGRLIAAAACLSLTATPVLAQGRKLDVSFKDGLVTIVAENVTVREILAEWARKGGSKVVNAERLGGNQIPILEYRDRPEMEVLRSLLRDAPGYAAAPRVETTAAGQSSVGAIFVLATRSVATSNAPVSSAAPVQQAPNQQNFQPPPQPQPGPQFMGGNPDTEIPPARPVQGPIPPSTPGAQPPTNDPNLRTGPGGTVTSTVPGVVIPAPGRAGGATGRGGGGGGR
jgi:hypothetical protein